MMAAKGSFMFRELLRLRNGHRVAGNDFLFHGGGARFGQNLRLFVKLDQWLASRVKEAGGDEHDKISLDMLVGRRAKEPARERNIPQYRDLIFYLLNVLADQPANDYGLAVIYGDFRGDFPGGENWLVDDVLRHDKVACSMRE